jgi:diguanylate cyclase (GGDEF)-like protein/PAS domain S-box-containing protein
MIGLSKPIARITVGLVGLTASLLLAAQLFGLIPDETRAILDGRRKIAETLAVQISSGAGQMQVSTLQDVLDSLVERNKDVSSAALRDRSGTLVVSAGQHERHWQPPADGRSSPDNVQVPIYAGEEPWGSAEIAFTPMPRPDSLNPRRNAVLMLVLFTAGLGSIAYFLLLRRSLKALDPSAVVPERVRAALDALVEGVVILDEQCQIVLANQSFAARLDVTATDFLGRNLSNLNWRAPETGGIASELPWRTAMQTGEPQTGVQLSLRSADGDIRRYMVNSTPIREGGSRVRGVLATFDDVTALEQRHADLQRALSQLKASQDQIELQNSELRFLADRDSLTGCLNRRAFFALFDSVFRQALSRGNQLSCVMIDIDHFKSVNDRYGHATGDKVIAYVAEILRSGLREGDLLCRYGGEEFCMVFPNAGSDVATQIAERLRAEIAGNSGGRFTAGMRITVSAGIASVPGSALEAPMLVNQADTALYTAKQSGRNCITRWDPAQTMRGIALADPGAGTDRNAVASGATTRVLKLQERVADLEDQLQDRDDAGEHDDERERASRAVFRDRVEQAIVRAQRKQRTAAILYVDLDLYERVENVLGVAAGDRLLEAVAERLSTLLRRSDTVALLGSNAKPSTLSRLGADHYAIVLDDLERVEPVTWIIQRIFQCLATPLEVDGQEIFVTCAIGASRTMRRTPIRFCEPRAQLASMQSNGSGQIATPFTQRK